MKKKQKIALKSKILSAIFSNPRYRGKHIVVVGEKIFAVSTGRQAANIFDRETKMNPKETPLTTYVPANTTLIL